MTHESLLVDRIRATEKSLTGWSNKGGEPLPLRSLLLEAADEIQRLREVLDLIDGVTGPYDDGYVEEVKALVQKVRGE